MSGSSSTDTQNTCGICQDITIQEDAFDDVELKCGHHFHYTCLQERDEEDKSIRHQCAVCFVSVLTDNKLIAKVVNSEGKWEMKDIGQDLDEDLDPLKRLQVAFRGFVNANRDFEAAKEILDDIENELEIVNSRYTLDGPTALHIAGTKNDKEAIRFLLEHGADKSIKSNEEGTPLEAAKMAIRLTNVDKTMWIETLSLLS